MLLGSIITLTLYQLFQTGDLLSPVHRVQHPDSLREVYVVRQGPCELHKQSIQGPEAIVGHGVHQAFEIFVSIAIKAHFASFPLRGERLEGACAVEAAVRAVRRARDQAVASGARLACGARVGPRRPVRLLAFLKVFKLNTSAQRHVTRLSLFLCKCFAKLKAAFFRRELKGRCVAGWRRIRYTCDHFHHSHAPGGLKQVQRNRTKSTSMNNNPGASSGLCGIMSSCVGQTSQRNLDWSSKTHARDSVETSAYRTKSRQPPPSPLQRQTLTGQPLKLSNHWTGRGSVPASGS